MSSIENTQKARSDYDRAIIKEEDAKLRRRFKTKLKLNIHPSNSQIEEAKSVPEQTVFGIKLIKVGVGSVWIKAISYPNNVLEDCYGYTDGVPDEEKVPHQKVYQWEAAYDGSTHPFKNRYIADEVGQCPPFDYKEAYVDIVGELQKIIEMPELQATREHFEGDKVTKIISNHIIASEIGTQLLEEMLEEDQERIEELERTRRSWELLSTYWGNRTEDLKNKYEASSSK